MAKDKKFLNDGMTKTSLHTNNKLI
jgi:hypothetical protein